MIRPSASARKLSDRIKEAIADHRITTLEYHEILEIVHEDGVVDAEERALLQELHRLIENGTVKQVAE
ncbi:MAG TPA: hypothetical protein PLI95_23440 [Polyangiaceae bacterium]|nr:hypothetical protein [Polyangiaceae bacterium]